MVLIDWLIAAVLVVSVLGAAKNGFFIEAFSLAGVILGLLIASWNFEKLTPWILHVCHTPAIANIISFLAIALVIMVAAGLVGRALHWSARSIGLGWLDRVVGAVFGLLKGCVVVTLAIMAFAAFVPHNRWLQGSQLVPYFLTAAHTTAGVTPVDLGEKIRYGVRLIRDAQPEWLRPHAEASTARLITG